MSSPSYSSHSLMLVIILLQGIHSDLASRQPPNNELGEWDSEWFTSLHVNDGRGASASCLHVRNRLCHENVLLCFSVYETSRAARLRRCRTSFRENCVADFQSPPHMTKQSMTYWLDLDLVLLFIKFRRQNLTWKVTSTKVKLPSYHYQ